MGFLKFRWATNGSMADAREVGSVLFDPPKPGPNPYAKDFNPSEHDYEKDKLVKPAVQAPVPVVPPQQKQILPVAIPQHQYPVAGPLAHPNAVIPYQPRVAPFPNQPGHEKFLRPGGSPPPHNYSQTINQYERDLPPGHPALNSRNPYGPPPPPKPKFRPPRYDEFGRLQDLSKDLHNLSHTFDADHIEGRHHIQNNPAYNPALATGPKQPIAAMGHQRPPEEPHVPFRFLQNNPNLHLNNPYYKGAQPIAAPRQF